MKIFKQIAYAYPTSTRAEELGGAGYFISQWCIREDGSHSLPYIAQGCMTDPFTDPRDPDLLELYHQAEGEPCPHFLRYSKDRHGL